MIRLDKALHAWGTPDFAAVLKQEIAQLGADQLPLQQGLSTGSHITGSPITVLINSTTETEDVIHVHAGIFYQSVIGGCSCEGDPTPTSENTEYCEVRFDIDKASAIATIALVT